ncbi:hypothetical protein RSOL_231910, partial [Rhizoctonia solani AG-3 Rhs1AP]
MTNLTEDLAWEDLKLMLDENCVRPFVWSSHNLLFLSDPLSPAIHVKHLPPAAEASRAPNVISQTHSYPLRFTLPPPGPILEMAHAYGPATTLSISPQDKYLFAFFPPAQPNVSTGGLGCIWGVEESLDTWAVKECWHYSAEAGVVAVRWLGEEREWHAQVGPTLRAARYPHLGPKLHYNHSAFLVVTADHSLHLYFQTYPSALDTSQPSGLHQLFNTLSVSLLSPTAAVQGHQEHLPVHDATLGGKRICIKAGIGLGYNGEILIHPRPLSLALKRLSISMAAVLDELIPEDNTGELTAMNWMRGGMWGEEDLIELCEVEIDLLSDEPCLVTVPLRSIPTPKDNESYLTHLLITSHPLESLAPALVADLAEYRCSFQVVASFLTNTVPMFISASPHRTLICTTSGTQRIPTVSIHAAPRLKGTATPSGATRMISSAIALQIRQSSGSDLSDVTRAMWEIVSRTNAVEASAALQNIFNEVFILLDSPLEYDVHQPWLMSLIGVLLTVYRICARDGKLRLKYANYMRRFAHLMIHDLSTKVLNMISLHKAFGNLYNKFGG